MISYAPFQCWREVVARRRAEALLRKAEMEESYHREQVLISSFSQPSSQGQGRNQLNGYDPVGSSTGSSRSGGCQKENVDLLLNLSLPAYHPSNSSVNLRYFQRFSTNVDESHFRHTRGPKFTADNFQTCYRCFKKNPGSRHGQETSSPDSCTCYNREGASQAAAYEESHTNICNVFWKSSLTFHPYKYGDVCVDFGSLWPEGSQLASLLLETYTAFGLKNSTQDLVTLVLRCGPLRVLKMMVQMRLIGQFKFSAIPYVLIFLFS